MYFLSVDDYAAGQMPISVYIFQASITTSGPEKLISVYTVLYTAIYYYDLWSNFQDLQRRFDTIYTHSLAPLHIQIVGKS